jgi:hypothetical protein
MKKKIIFLPLLFLLAATGLKAQMWNFATKLEGTLGLTDKVVIKGIDVDASSNSYVTGYYTGQLNSSVSLNSLQQDGFVAKFDVVGTLLWVHKFGGPGNDAGNAISFETFGSGAFFITGYVQYNDPAPVTFNGSSGSSQSLPSVTACAAVAAPNNIYLRQGLSSKQAFVAKYSAAGNILWVKPIYSASCLDAEGLGICAAFRHDPSLGGSIRDIYVTGYFEGNGASFMSSSPCTFINVTGNALNKTAFVAKLSNNNGNASWARSFSIPSNVNAMSVGKNVTVDYYTVSNGATNGGVFVTGDYQTTTNIGGTTLTGGSDTRAYVASLNTSNGSAFWVREIVATGAGANVRASDIASRPGPISSYDELYVYGDFGGSNITIPTLTTTAPSSANGGFRDIYLARFVKSSGVQNNIIADGGGDNQHAGGLDLSWEGVSGSIDLFVSGAYDNTMTFTGGPSFNASGSSTDQFMARYSTFLSNTCAEHWDAGKILNAYTMDACDVAMLKQSGIAHAFYGGMFFGGESPVFSGTTLTTPDPISGFVSKWVCCACPAPTISVNRTPPNATSATITFTWPPCNNPSAPQLFFGSFPNPATPWPIVWGAPSTVVNVLNPSLTYTWVVVTTCQDSSNVASRPSSIKENLLDPNLKFDVYPNPTEHMLYFEANQEGKVEIYSLLGALVKTKTISGSKAEVDVSGLPEGNYVCKFTSQNNAVITKKIQVMH